MVKIRPAIHKFDFLKGSPRSWGWVRLGELAEMFDTSPAEVIRQWGFLSKDYSQYNVLAIVVERIFENADIDRLVETIEHFESEGLVSHVGEQVFVPAGWANSVIDQATGVTEARRKQEIEREAERIVFESLRNGYSQLRYSDLGENFIWAQDVISAVRLLAHRVLLGEINAEVNRVLSSDPPPYSQFETIFYDLSRFETAKAYHGQHYFQEKARLGYGWFSVTADGVHLAENGAVYYLREK